METSDTDIVKPSGGNSSGFCSRDSFILALAKSGATYADIGRCVSLSRERVRQIVQSYGIFRQDSIAQLHQSIEKLATEGRTVGEIAVAVNRDFSYVDHYCRQNRLRVPRRSSRLISGTSQVRKKPSEELPRVIELVAQGKTTMQIATELGQPYHTIYSLRKRNSV